MSPLPRALLANVCEMILAHEVHQDRPVNLMPILQRYRIELHIKDFPDGIRAVYVPATRLRCRRMIGVDGKLSPASQRVAIAHELGHYLAGHPNGIHLYDANEWMSDKLERQAQLIASMLLIPEPHDWARGLTAEEIAQECWVTEDLVQLHWAVFHGVNP